jgi:YegS/Rv2252/BmrU family lipid kinase
VPRHAVLVNSKDAGAADQLDAARQVLEGAGWRIEDVVPVAELDRLTERVTGADPPLVIAAGGDGTVGAAADVVAGSGALLAVLPLGTSNDIARSLGIPPDPCEAAAAIVAGRPAAVDAAQLRVGDEAPRVYLNAATVGLNVAFARAATDDSVRDRFGGLTYPIAAARAVRSHQPFECTIESDDGTQTFSAVHVSVSNAPVFGGVLGMRVPGASMTDGLLDVIVIERLSLARVALAVADTVIGRHRPVHRVHTLRARTLRVSAPGRQEVAVDGEVVGALPAEFTALPGGLPVVLPIDTDS